MRQAFCDESYSKDGPWFVVAGPIVHADTQLVAVEARLEELIEKYIPAEDRDGFVFHASDIWNNNEYFKDRARWPRDLCWEILWDLCQIPWDLGLPIVIGIKLKESGREAVAQHAPDLSPEEIRTAEDATSHGTAFVDFTHQVERIMREQWADEIAELVVENRRHFENSLADVHHMLKKKERLGEWVVKPSYFPLTHIRGGIKFSAKRDEPVLQIADLAAYIVRAALEQSLDHAPFYNTLRRVLLSHPKDLNWPPLEWPGGPLVPLWKESPEEKASELGRLRRLLRRARRERLRNARKGNVE